MVYNFSKFINKKYGIGDTHSAYISGAVYDVSMVLSPFLGGLIVSIWLFCKPDILKKALSYCYTSEIDLLLKLRTVYTHTQC